MVRRDSCALSAAGVEALVEAFGERAERDAPLGARTTYRVGGRAAISVRIDSHEDLRALHRALVVAGRPVPLVVVGQGSNLLVSDAGFAGVVVSLGNGFDWVEVRSQQVRAGGATPYPVVARRSAAAGLRGLEWAVGVPGSVGGALAMNAGGHGSDTAAVLARYCSYDLESGVEAEHEAERLAFGYRHSALGPGELVLWAQFDLERAEPADTSLSVSEVVRWRRAHQPGGPNAGSVFTNPPGDAAGRLVEAAGLKGSRIGSACVSEKHANFIQADEGGSADDVRRLIEHVRAEVAVRTGVDLATEVRLVGFEDVPPTLVHARG
ncbi:MAG TPA: UDP-N-acetylmuramate dehydrogenase [Acidimicrobiales bacterium]|nr:UDP-N-acetylmuramate dehydrogenase [Acidimicrobiales bacterium]